MLLILVSNVSNVSNVDNVRNATTISKDGKAYKIAHAKL